MNVTVIGLDYIGARSVGCSVLHERVNDVPTMNKALE
jgi:hypothetical protein